MSKRRDDAFGPQRHSSGGGSVAAATAVAVVAAVVAVAVAAGSLASAGVSTDVATGPPTVSAKQAGVRLRPGPAPGTVIVTSDDPLSLVTVRSGSPGVRVRVISSGADYARANTWLQAGAGVMCWAEKAMRATTTWTVRKPSVPFRAVPNAWRWSSIALVTTAGIGSVRRPVPGTVLQTADPISKAIMCARPVTGGPDRQRLRGAPAAPPGKVTICHATSSRSNPYRELSVAQPAARNGHGGHTGPLFPQPGWGDVIPPFPGFPGLNWPAGEALWNNGCRPVPGQPLPPVDPPVEVKPPDPDGEVPVIPPIIIDPGRPGTPSPTTTTGSPSTSGSTSATVPSSSPVTRTQTATLTSTQTQTVPVTQTVTQTVTTEVPTTATYTATVTSSSPPATETLTATETFSTTVTQTTTATRTADVTETITVPVTVVTTVTDASTTSSSGTTGAPSASLTSVTPPPTPTGSIGPRTVQIVVTTVSSTVVIEVPTSRLFHTARRQPKDPCRPAGLLHVPAVPAGC